MPKVHHRKARKDYPDQHIKAGDMYYTWSLKTGPRSSRTYRQLSPPRRSQLTTSGFLQQLYDLEDQLSVITAEDIVDLTSQVEDLASQIRELGEEEQGKYDNMPEGLQQGDTGMLLEERAQAMEAWADELEQVCSSWDEDTDLDEAIEEIVRCDHGC
jgi:hypothetical protein